MSTPMEHVEETVDWMPASNETFIPSMMRRFEEYLLKISSKIDSINLKLGSIEVEQMNLSRRLEKIEESSTLKKTSSSREIKFVEEFDIVSSDEDAELKKQDAVMDKILQELPVEETVFSSSPKRMRGNVDPRTPAKSLTRSSTSQTSQYTSSSSCFYNYIFADDKAKDEVISSCNKIYVTRDEMKSLAPERRIKNGIITLVSALLTTEERRRTDNKAAVWFLPIKLTRETLPPSTLQVHEIWKKYKYFQDYMGSLSICNEIYIPILFADHYTLARVMVKTKNVEVWDTLASKDEPIENILVIRKILSILDIFFEDEILKLRDARFNFGTFSINRHPYVPLQQNTFDCGIFVIFFMRNRCSLDSRSHKFDSDLERRKAAVWIASSKHNEEGSKLRNNIYKQ